MNSPVLITDLVKHVTHGELSPKTSSEHWRIVEYELEDIGSGRGVAIGDWNPGPLTIRLGVKGHYRIHLISRYANLHVKLSGDQDFQQCGPERRGHQRISPDEIYREGYFDTEEVFWRQADLTGQDLILADRGNSGLLAIHLVPTDPPRPETRPVVWPMAFTLDGGDMGSRIHEKPDDFFESAELVPRNSCMRVLIYGGIAGDICYHHTKVGSEFGSVREKGEAWSQHHRDVVENLQTWRKWGKNPAQAMVEYAHGRGWECHLYQRLGWDGYVPNNGYKASRFFLSHPEYHTRGPNDEKVMGLSVAYPEVVEHWAAFYAELASYGADGVTPCFIRGCPLVLYEKIMREGFHKEYGEDPRMLPPDHPDWQDYRARIVTEFMRSMKKALGKCRLSPIIHGTQALNRRFALDIATWVREGIVDDLFIMGHQYDRQDCHFAGGPEHIEYDYFQNLPGREKIRLWPMFYTYGASEAYRRLGYNFTMKVYCQAFQQFMDDGADGYCLWDATTLDPETNIFDLGRKPRSPYHDRLVRKYELIQWDGWLWNRYSPLESS